MTHTTPKSSHDQGSFLTGFTFGLFAGAAGYFMFGTQKGKKLREKLADEWENARSEAGDSLPNMSWREMLRSLVKSFQDQADAEVDKPQAKKAVKPAPKDTKSKFKGVEPPRRINL